MGKRAQYWALSPPDMRGFHAINPEIYAFKQKKTPRNSERLMIRSVSSGLEAATTDDAYAGPPLGATAGGGVGSFHHCALGLEVGVGGLP